MDIGPYSRKQVMTTFVQWDVPKEYADPFYNYLVYGYSPGGFFTSVLANDWSGAVMRSHPSNTIEALKAITGWIRDYIPSQARGSYPAVDHWCRLDSDTRTKILLEHNLILPSKTEVFKALKGESANDPFLY